MLRGLGAWVAAWAVYLLIGGISGAALLRGAPSAPGAMPASLLAGAVVVGLAAVLAGRLAGRGPRRALILFALLFVPQANNFAELMIFPLDLRARLVPLLILHAALLSAGAAGVLDALTAAGPASPSCWPARRGPFAWLSRALACDLAYIVAYMTAGMIVWPFVRAFYQDRAMPTLATVVTMQVFRGLVFTGLLAWFLRELRAPRRVALVLGGLVLAVFGGIELIVPNPYLPDFARHAHLVEVCSSNFVFGAAVVWLLSGRELPAT